MKTWRSGLAALTVAMGTAAGASMAAADGPEGDGWFDTPWTWAGTYFGAHLGSADFGWDDEFVGGVQLGRNWQSGKMIYGIEGDLSLTGADDVDWMGSVRGRLGYLLSPGILLYGTAGLGVVDFERDSETGLVAGLGVEGRVTEASTLRLEYLSYDTDFDDVDVLRAGMNFKF